MDVHFGEHWRQCIAAAMVKGAAAVLSRSASPGELASGRVSAEQVEPTTNYHQGKTEKLHVHTWQWHLTGVSLPATAPRTAWHLRCEKYSTGRAPHKQITGGELLQNDFKMSVNYM